MIWFFYPKAPNISPQNNSTAVRVVDGVGKFATKEMRHPGVASHVDFAAAKPDPGGTAKSGDTYKIDPGWWLSPTPLIYHISYIIYYIWYII